MQQIDLCADCAPTEEQFKQDPSTALGADWPKGWPKPSTIISAASGPTTYSILDLLKLMRKERAQRVQLDAGYPPKLVVKGKSHEIEGPAVDEESIEEMLRAVASTREMRAFRKTGAVDIVVPFEGLRFLVRAVRAFGECRVELQPITV